MDLGIRGRRAIVCASSRGLGKACALALAEAGVTVVINGRFRGPLEQTAEEIRRQTNVEVIAVTADVSTREGQASLLSICPDPDILVNNGGGLLAQDVRQLDRDSILEQATKNVVAPIELIQSVVEQMVERDFGRIINIVSVDLNAHRPSLDESNAGRAGLTRVLSSLICDVASRNVTINDLVPAYFDTQHLHDVLAIASTYNNISEQQVIKRVQATIPAGRFGMPSELGQICAFLCSVDAGYITGQSILADGGYYPTPV